MGRLNSFNEVLDFAMEQEIEANKFYLALAKKTRIPAMKEVFLSFAEEEQGHKAKLEQLKGEGGIKVSQKQEQKPVPDLQIADYLIDLESSPDMDYQDALIVAMKKEKAAYRLYSDLAAVAQSQEVKEIFLWLAQEEAKHKLRFEIEYDDMVLEGN